jgi:hypothetical protein
VSLLAPGALAGLVLLAPLLILHLRHRRPPVRSVPSLLLDGDGDDASRARSRAWSRPPLPLLLALQLLAVILLVVGLAKPAGPAHRRGGASAVYVLDGSVWMGARDGGDTRMGIAQRRLQSLLRGQGGHDVAIVLAGVTPHVVYRGAASSAGDAIRRATPSATTSTLTRAVALAADERASATAPVVVLHAPESPAPRASAAAGVYQQQRVGGKIRDRGFAGTAVRCGLQSAGSCTILATVRQTGERRGGDVPVQARSGGRVVATATARIPSGNGSAPVVLTAPPGSSLRLTLPAGDALAADDATAIAVPAAATPHVNVVGAADRAGDLTRVFEALPRAQVRAIAPAAYRSADARDADLLVLDGWLPRGELPRARSILLVDPPRVPGGAVGARLADGGVSGSDATSPLLDGIDVDALTADTGAARRVTPPGWVQPVVWAPGGPLLSAGSDGVHHLAILSFDPGDSGLPQSEAFPLLAASLVAWAQSWLPATAQPGTGVQAQVPPGTTWTALGKARRTAAPATFTAATAGIATATQHGDWGVRTQGVGVAVDARASTAGAVDLLVDPALPRSRHDDDALWLLAAAFVVLLAEWLLSARVRSRAA